MVDRARRSTSRSTPEDRGGEPARAGATHVALLRGVNVGGKNRLAMAALARLFEAAGARRVRTYIQSGNVVFDAPRGSAEAVVRAAGRALAEHLGREIALVTRGAEELRAATRRNPFLAAGVDPAELHVAFLDAAPSRALGAGLAGIPLEGDAFHLRGREIYLHFPRGLARTQLTVARFDRLLRTTTTVRNWRTVLALAELAEQ